jgi:putative hydrolase of the HAD superfamily
MFSLFRQSKYYSVFPDVIEVLNILKAKRYRLGLISNYDASLWQTLEDLHLKDYFNPIVISVEAGFEKPHPGIFQLALKQVELKPEECVFVGDNPVSDAKGAAAIGMGSILIDRYQRYADNSEWTRVQNFKQLLEIL